MKKLTFLSVMAMGALIANTVQAAPKKAELEQAGYTCEVVSVNFMECTKAGEKTYWCTGHTCEAKPRRVPTKPNLGGIYRPPTHYQ